MPKEETKEITKLAFEQFVKVAVSHIMPQLGIGSVGASFVTDLITYLANRGVERAYTDLNSRLLSDIQSQNVYDVFSVASQQIARRLEADNYVYSVECVDDSAIESSLEGVLQIVMDAMNTAQTKKRKIMGLHLGDYIVDGTESYNELFAIQKIITDLTVRQFVLIRLICNDFKETVYADKLDRVCITNPTVLVELNQLKDKGIWGIDGVMQKDFKTGTVQLNIIKKTTFAQDLYEKFHLKLIPMDDIKKVISEMNLKLDTSSLLPENVATKQYLDTWLSWD